MKFLIIAFFLSVIISHSEASSVSCDIDFFTGKVLTDTCKDLGDALDE